MTLSHVRLFTTPWTVAYQAPPSLGLSRQEYWSGLPFPPPGDLPDPRIELMSLSSPALARGFFTISATWEALGWGGGGGRGQHVLLVLNCSGVSRTRLIPVPGLSITDPKPSGTRHPFPSSLPVSYLKRKEYLKISRRI